MSTTVKTKATPLVILVTALSFFAGCSTCCSQFDSHYLYEGGKHARTNAANGRVGSALSEQPAAYVSEPNSVIEFDDSNTPKLEILPN